MKLSKDIKWLWPYLDSISDLIDLKKIGKIHYYKNREGKKVHHQAICHRLGNNKIYNIFIRTNLAKENRIPLDINSQEDVLFFLAHELSHLVHWSHTKDHFKLTAKLYKRFAEKLHQIDFEIERNQC